MPNDSRWKQRFQNFEKAYLLLEDSLQIDSPSILEKAGIIQFFEISFELAWKVLKNYLEEDGFNVRSPRETIKKAFQSELIKDGHVWIEALDNRNLTVHTYDKVIAEEVYHEISLNYFPFLRELYYNLKERK